MKGFSLLEIMVTVGIISIMAASVIVGFNAFSRTIQVQETAGVISDTLRRLELDVVRGDYEQETIHFQPDYLVVEGEIANQSLSLEWNGQGGCQANEEELEVQNPDPLYPVYLAKRDQYGNNLEISTIPAGPSKTFCVGFLNSDETEWLYQVFQQGHVSPVIRFLHFNIQRNGVNDIAINSNSYTLEIDAPYAKKTVYQGGSLLTGTASISIQDGEGNTKDIVLQE